MTTNLHKSELPEVNTATIKGESFDYELTKEDLRIIQSRKKALKSGKAKTISINEMQKRFTAKFTS